MLTRSDVVMALPIRRMKFFPLGASLVLVGAAACGGTGKTPAESFVDAGVDARHDATHSGGHQGMLGQDSSMPDVNSPEACASTMNSANVSPLDMVILLDWSGSMAYNNAWTYETQALETFFYDINSAGIGVGLIYMPQVDLCNVEAYSLPAVPIATLPAASGSLITSLGNTRPFGGTPITVGLEGAVAYATARQTAFPDHKVVIIFSTDGVDINSCSIVPDGGGLPNTQANAIAVLQQAAAAGIKTFVIGVSPEPQTNAFAAAGGTGQAILIGAVDGGVVDIEGDLIAAFSGIRDQALPCEVKIPASSGGKIDDDDVNVSFSATGDAAASQQFFGVANAAACKTQGPTWYYDNPTAPQNIELCPEACQLAKSSQHGDLNVVFGCTMTIPPPPDLK